MQNKYLNVQLPLIFILAMHTSVYTHTYMYLYPLASIGSRTNLYYN